VRLLLAINTLCVCCWFCDRACATRTLGYYTTRSSSSNFIKYGRDIELLDGWWSGEGRREIRATGDSAQKCARSLQKLVTFRKWQNVWRSKLLPDELIFYFTVNKLFSTFLNQFKIGV
jgi:hypothetical protein